MTFGEPVVLVGLLAVPAVALAYVDMNRRRERQGAAFASPALRASVVRTSPGFGRHAAPIAFLLALTILIVALARPERTVAVEVEQASIILVTDYSGSMQATDVQPNRLVAVRRAAAEFLKEVPDTVRVGLIAFNQNVRLLQSPTTDREAINGSLESLVPAGGTASGDALALALTTLRRQRGDDGRPIPGAVVLLSDGESTRGREPEVVARTAAQQKVPVYTVALGTAQGTIKVKVRNRTETRRVPPDVAAMRQVAQISGGEAFTSTDAAQLSAVYEKLGRQVGEKKAKRQMTAGFAGISMVLMLAGVGLSLYFFRRVT